MNNELLIQNGNVWDGVKFSKQDVLVENGIIKRIQKNIKEKAEKVFDAEGMIVSSGLIDFHTHIKHISPDNIGIEAEKISFPFGVTHLVDASARQVEKNQLWGMDCDVSVLPEVLIVDNKADFSCVEAMKSAYNDRLIGLKVFLDTTFVEVYNTEPLKDICDYAKKNDLFVMVHTANSPVKMFEIVNVLNEGDIISHAFHGGCNNASEDSFLSLKYAKEKGIYTDAALSAYYHIDYSVFKQAMECGIYPDIISSDITKDLEFVSNQKYGLTISMSILKKLGMNTENIFKAVTVTPSSLLKSKRDKGVLSIGNVADIAVFEIKNTNFTITDRYDNIIMLKQYLKCVLTINNGQIVYVEH